MAAGRYALPVTIFVPRGNSIEKNRAMQAFGATLVEHGEDFQAAREEAGRRAKADGLEIRAGLSSRPRSRGSDLRARAVQEGPRPRRSRRADRAGVGDLRLHPGARPARSENRNRRRAVDGGAVLCAVVRGRHRRDDEQQRYARGRHGDPRPDADALAIIRKGASRIVQVTDGEIGAAIRAYWTDTHNLAEGAGAAALAAALQERARIRGKRVGLVLSGGNIDFDLFNRWVVDATSPTSSSGLTGRSSTPRPEYSPQAAAITGCPPARADKERMTRTQ